MWQKSILLVALVCTLCIFGVLGQGFGNFGRREGGVPERGSAFPSNGGFGNRGFGNVPKQNGNFGNLPQSSGQFSPNGNFGRFPENSGPFAQTPGNFPQQQYGGFRPARFPGRF